MTPTPPGRNNPGYTPEYKELEEARRQAKYFGNVSTQARYMPEDGETMLYDGIRWLAAEVRVMRLERALER